VTHDSRIAHLADHIMQMQDGKMLLHKSGEDAGIHH
jgi:ABC-type lipoprotein export system ATPase subunit